ncbi:MAG: hypothetical protein HQ521_00070 [Bacteroidetes bacterium]|nr:hypothetical protein [Bacteroidota bacterium]
MVNEEILITGIEYKVRKLIEVNSFLKKENERFFQESELSAKKIIELNNKIEENQKEIFKFTLANTLEIEFGVEEGSKRIDSLIDEIDRCIEVLSE